MKEDIAHNELLLNNHHHLLRVYKQDSKQTNPNRNGTHFEEGFGRLAHNMRNVDTEKEPHKRASNVLNRRTKIIFNRNDA
jgi:hypothetical protein